MSCTEVGEVGLRAGANYLAQATRVRPDSVALPAARGVSIWRQKGTTPEPDGVVELDTEVSTILALAWCPTDPELLALAPGAADVQLLKLRADRTTAAEATLALNGAPCRQLTWHPHRRVLAVALPDKLVLAEMGRPSSRTPSAQAALTTHELKPPGKTAGAISSCAWGVSGGVLAAACEREVVLFHWALRGAAWERHTCLRHPVPTRRLCVLSSFAAGGDGGAGDDGDDDDDDDDAAAAAAAGGDGSLGTDAFALGLGVPVVIGDGADMSCNGSPRLLSAGEIASARNRVAAPPPEAPAIVDLRGRIGGVGGVGGVGGTSGVGSNLLDLSSELEAVRAPTLSAHKRLADETGRGALLVCGVTSGSAVSIDMHMWTCPYVRMARP